MFTSNFELLLDSTWATLYMVFCSSILSIFLGTGVGLSLYLTQKGQVWENKIARQILGFIVNLGRSIPFIILMVALIPFTRLVVGTSIGNNAAIVPLTIGAIPFYARLAETAFKQVGRDLLEAGKAMGLTPWQTIFKIVLPESKHNLLEGATLTVITLIAYSAIVGAIGGGGLGEVAILYGYQRFDIPIMIYTIIILFVLVQLVQWLGDISSKRRTIWLWSIVSIPLLIGSFFQIFGASFYSGNTIKVGIVGGPSEEIMVVANQVAEEQYGIHLKIVEFNDYVLPNEALNDGEIDANIFQHIPYLDSQIKAHGYKISVLTKTFVYPMGFFSDKITNINQLPYGALVAVPNDPSNEGRALLLLQANHLISLKQGVGLLPSLNDIIANPKGLQFKELDAADVPRALPDVEMGAVTNDYASAAHLSLNQAILKEGPDSPYGNIVAVQTSRLHDPKLQSLIAIMHSKEVVDETEKLFPNGAAIPAWANS